MTEADRRMQELRERLLYELQGGDRAQHQMARELERQARQERTKRRLRWLWYLLGVVAASGLFTR